MYFDYEIPDEFRWFPQSRYGLFIHWGPYACLERGEQVLFREHLNQTEYEEMAVKWNPGNYHPEEWAVLAKKAGFRYACFTSRHHDGYCLWNTKTTNYNSMEQAPHRDFLREYTEAFRAEGLKVGVYYSWCDWRISTYYQEPSENPKEWERMRAYIWKQVEEICTQYGKIDYFFFDGVWPRNAEDLKSLELVKKMRKWQPGIIINNRLGVTTESGCTQQHGGGFNEGDFGTPEFEVLPENRLWEACRVSTKRWWGYHKGERFHSAEDILDTLCSCVSQGGNLILNVGPDKDGNLPTEFQENAVAAGRWLEQYGEAIYGNDGGNLTEAQTYGFQTIKDNCLYLILKFWKGTSKLRITDLLNEVVSVTLMGVNKELSFEKKGSVLMITGIPELPEEWMFPVIRIECKGKPKTNEWGSSRLWEGNPKRIAEWAQSQRKDGTFFDTLL